MSKDVLFIFYNNLCFVFLRILLLLLNNNIIDPKLPAWA